MDGQLERLILYLMMRCWNPLSGVEENKVATLVKVGNADSEHSETPRENLKKL